MLGMVTFWVAVLVLPLPSLNIQVTTVVPGAVIGNIVVVVPVTIPAQLSVAVGAVKVAGVKHALTTVPSIGGTGAIVSFTITFWVAVLLLPLPSSNVQTIVLAPCAE